MKSQNVGVMPAQHGIVQIDRICLTVVQNHFTVLKGVFLFLHTKSNVL